MIPDWPSLWKRDPTLSVPEWGHEVQSLPLWIVAALCREAAVQWLARRDDTLGVSIALFEKPSDSSVGIELHLDVSGDIDRDHIVYYNGIDYDHALFAACVAVLDQEKPKEGV